MKKSSVSLIIISFLLIVASLGAVLYAWFGLVEKTQPILIYSGKIELTAILYDEEENEINNILIDKVIPGDVFTYTLDVKNKGTILGNLDLLYTFDISSNLKDYIEFSINDNTLEIVDGEYLYQTTLDKNESKTITFSIKIHEDLEISMLTENDKIIIESIFINLIQAV